MEKVILVDEQDNILGEMEKMEAHEKGLLHRAFSVFVFNNSNQLLLQRRALNKYHSGGLWTNTCCSHPRKGEKLIDAGMRRLQEEMGFTTSLKEQFSFIYYAKLDQGLIEHELDHVLFGRFNELTAFNTEEVMDAKFVELKELEENIIANPQLYTEWFKIIFERSRKAIYEMINAG